MPTRKISGPDENWKFKKCLHPEHNPPMFQVFEPGTYEHECPSCHHKIVFVIGGRPDMWHPNKGDKPFDVHFYSIH